MSDHEDLCAITLGYNWCTCIRYAEQVVEHGYELHLQRSGERICGNPEGSSNHDHWFITELTNDACPSCRASV